MISILHEAFFAGSRGSLAKQYQDRFVSSITDGPRKHEQELPDAMVSMAATTISYFPCIVTFHLDILFVDCIFIG
jgi:hypothetical protein